MDQTNWLNHPSLQKMEPEKKQIMIDFIKETQNLPLNKAIMNISAMEARLKAKNLSFTDEDTQLVTSILLPNMSPQQRTQFEALKMMMNQRKSKKK